jgi:pimeloyl-ACP methyl ester carboxylesterase
MGIYDLPTMTDYILNKTGQKDLYYIGFSMGATMFFVFTSMKPEYNEKIRLMIALAPSTFMSNSTTPINKLKLFSKVWQCIDTHYCRCLHEKDNHMKIKASWDMACSHSRIFYLQQHSYEKLKSRSYLPTRSFILVILNWSAP